VLPLRAASQVAEDLAWTHFRFPGRVGVGVAAGALPVDFELAGVPFEEMFPRHRRATIELLGALNGTTDSPVNKDPAIAALRPGDIPAVAAVQAPATVRRAAGQGMGVLFDSLQTADRTRALTDAYREAGGTGATILIRRVWIGPPPTGNVEAQMDRYRGYTSERARTHWAADNGLVAGATGEEVADTLHRMLVASGCDTVNLRVFLAGISPPEVAAQIDRHGAETVPALRERLASPAR
jgi:alkanesulfonate monooxygenase SsuD/methylene tetrahydromethanopterin reductase-like flavin-dependent oxidoreductase (luciferase family)